MTTDSEAWVRLAAPVLAAATANYNATESAQIAAECADAALALYRERQKRGDFGASTVRPPCPVCGGACIHPAVHLTRPAGGPSTTASEEALREALKDAHERIARLTAAQECRPDGASWGAKMVAERHRLEGLIGDYAQSLYKARTERDEQRARADEAVRHCTELRETYLQVLARAEAAEAHLRGLNEAHEAAESLLKEALGSLGEFLFIFKGNSGALERARAVVKRAKAQGFLPDGEVTT